MLKAALSAMEEKNRLLVQRLEKLMKDTTSLSVMDFKIAFDKYDRTIT
jgi:hypothetical protein